MPPPFELCDLGGAINFYMLDKELVAASLQT